MNAPFYMSNHPPLWTVLDLPFLDYMRYGLWCRHLCHWNPVRRNKSRGNWVLEMRANSRDHETGEIPVCVISLE